MMANWYFYSVSALLLLGGQRFLYKVTAERGYGSGLTSAIFMCTVTLLSGIVFLASGAEIQNWHSLAILSLANSVSFSLATVANIEALRYLPAGITFPLTRLSLVVVVAASVYFFKEQLSLSQWVGILLGGAVIVVMALDVRSATKSARYGRLGFLYVTACVLCGAIAAITSKLAAVSTNKAAFMTLSYSLGALFSLAIERKWGNNNGSSHPGGALAVGILMGILNFFGFYAFLTALQNGPLSAIALMTGMHFIIAIILSVLIYRESLTPHRCAGIVFTVLAIIMLRQ